MRYLFRRGKHSDKIFFKATVCTSVLPHNKLEHTNFTDIFSPKISVSCFRSSTYTLFTSIQLGKL